MTDAPAEANPAAMANPSPLDPPVMMATLLDKSKSLIPGRGVSDMVVFVSGLVIKVLCL